MATWFELLRRLWRGSQKTPAPPSHLGGQGIPNILGVCERCGAVVVEGLHQPTSTGFLCQRCAGSRDPVA